MPPNSLHLYGYKRAADDIAALAKELNAPKIILGGHDWYVVIFLVTSVNAVPLQANADK